MKKEDTLNIVEKCFHGDPPSCAHYCPFHLDIRSFCEKAQAGRWNTVYKYMRDSMIFPVIVQNLCSMTCAEKCQRPLIGDEAINMTLLEDAVLRYSKNKAPIKFAIPEKKESVAIIGAGVAGLSVALNLSQKRYKVTVFDKNSSSLGSLISHQNENDFREDVNLQFSVVPCEFEFNKTINSLEELSDFDAVFIAIGDLSENDTTLKNEIEKLMSSYNPEYFSTSEQGIFMGGELCGYSKIQAIADSVKIANVLESYLMTGKPLKEKEEKFLPERVHMLDHSDEEKMPIISPSDGESYSEEEAKLEASRCFLCDCRACLDKCEMLSSFSKRPQKLAQEAYADTNVAPPFSSCTLTKEVFSCHECDYCKTICPVDINLGDLFQIAKSGRVEVKTEPKAYHEYWLRDFDFASDQVSHVVNPRSIDTKDNDVSSNNSDKKYVFFPGCKLGEVNPEYVTKTYDTLREKLGAGIVLNCCGVPALWAGENKLFHEHLQRLSEIWDQTNHATFVFACSYCEKVFRKYLPQIDAISLYSLLAAHPEILPEKQTEKQNNTDNGASCVAETTSGNTDTINDKVSDESVLEDTMAIFDPCAASENQSCKDAVRELCRNIGLNPLELNESGKCCGFGGHMRTVNDSLYDKIIDNRISADDAPYILYCANCLDTFRNRGKECKHILDILFDIDSSMTTINLHEKRQNMVSIKNMLMKQEGEGEYKGPTNPWDHFSLIVDEITQSAMNDKLILSSDIKETIYKAGQDKTTFTNYETGTTLAFHEKPLIIFWVEYIITGDSEYKIVNTYYHRMHPRSDSDA